LYLCYNSVEKKITTKLKCLNVQGKFLTDLTCTRRLYSAGFGTSYNVNYYVIYLIILLFLINYIIIYYNFILFYYYLF